MTRGTRWREVCGERAWRKFKRILGWSRGERLLGSIAHFSQRRRETGHSSIAHFSERRREMGHPQVLPTSRKDGEEIGHPQVLPTSRKSGEKWGTPEARGQPTNTAGAEYSGDA